MKKSVRDRMLGKVYETNFGGSCVVIDYNSSLDVLVEFLDDFKFTTKTTTVLLKAGRVRNYYSRSVYGVGYIGEGKYKVSKNNKHFQHYHIWTGMFERSYSEVYHKSRPTYIGCSVCPEWHNFQVFSDWYINQKFYGLGYHLDKDLLVDGNKVYSPETCVLLPPEINLKISRVSNQESGNKQGVFLSKNGKRYIARCGTNNKNLGVYDSLEEASKAYCNNKEKQMKILAEKWKGKIDERAYLKLLNWTVIINNQ